MKFSTKLYLLSISILFTSISIIIACGPFGWMDFSDNTLITPEIIQNPKAEKFFWSNKYSFYKQGFKDNYKTSFNEINIQEWKYYFQNNITEDKLKFWLYDSNLKEIDEMIFSLQGKGTVTTENGKKFSLTGSATPNSCIDFLFYVGFARRNEEFTATSIDLYNWDEPKKTKDLSQIQKQIEGGLRFFDKEKNDFLKERFIFQLIRLYYFNSQYEEAISFYKKQEASFKSNNSMKARSLGYVAASHVKLNQFGKANYLYAYLFAKEPMMQEAAFLSFRPQSGKDWEESLKLAKSNIEKTALWFLFGVTFDPETAIQEIYKIDSQSDYLEVLLVKEINHLEEHFLLVQPSLPLVGINIDETHQFYSRKKSFLKTVTDITREDKIKNKFVWNISSAYLNYTYSNFSEGDSYLAKAKTFMDKEPKNKLLYNSQFSIVYTYGKLLSNSKLTPSIEADILPHVKNIFAKPIETIPNFRYDYPRFWITNAIAVRYASQGEYEKAEVVQHGTLRLHFSKIENTKKMISYFDRKDHSELEKFYQAKSPLKKRHYQQLLGIHYALQDELELSLETFKSIPNYKYSFQTDPFAIRKKDCYECDILPKSAKRYDSIYFLQKIIDLKKEALQNKAKQAENYFLIANAFYNISFFGTSKFYRNDVHSFQQNYEMWQYSKFSKMDFPEMDNSVAMKYYLLAANASNDPEFKAKMNFFAAKAELNEWHLQNKNYDKHFQSGLYYSILKKNFSNTKYYSEIIKECTYFAKYINGK